MNSVESIPIEPMSAGDIIDRAVRVYRRNALPLLWIVIGPSLIAFAGSVLWSLGWRNSSLERGDGRVALTAMMIVVGATLWVLGKAAFYATLGGSARALIAHFFDGQPIRAREVFAAVRARKWSLLGALLMLGLITLAVALILLFVEGILIAIVGTVSAAVMFNAPGWLRVLWGIVVIVVLGGVALLAFLLVYSRIVYVPQVMMVENKGVFSSISRSFTLARGEMRRIGAVTLFWFYVAWSLLWLLGLPVGAYAWWSHGIDVTPFSDNVPLWYAVVQQTITQVSEILIAPIAMLGFTLLYLNSRMRKEGYDVEVLANRLLAAPPTVPAPQASVSTPSLPTFDAFDEGDSPFLGLGLRGYQPTAGVPAAAVSQATVEQPVAVTTENAAAVAAATLADEPAKNLLTKTCRWCGTAVAMEDRFCRVCGSVF